MEYWSHQCLSELLRICNPIILVIFLQSICHPPNPIHPCTEERRPDSVQDCHMYAKVIEEWLTISTRLVDSWLQPIKGAKHPFATGPLLSSPTCRTTGYLPSSLKQRAECQHPVCMNLCYDDNCSSVPSLPGETECFKTMFKKKSLFLLVGDGGHSDTM